MAYDIFISYRRKDCAGLTSGTDIARTIKQQLEIEGYKHRVFFDYSELSDDDFEKIILKAIERCKVFILVLSRDSMIRCVNDDDWVRREILHAQKCGLKIIPVEPDNLFNGYPDEFPAELDVVKRIQHTTIHMDSSFERDMRAMIESRITPILPAGDAESKSGALVKIDSDLECRVLDFGEEIATIGTGMNEIRLSKGNHEITFVGVESYKDSFDYGELDIRDLEYVYRINVRLLDKYNARKAEEKRRAEERKRQDEERMRKELEAQEEARRQMLLREKQRKEQELREQRMKEEAAKAAIRKKCMWIAGLILVAILGCYGTIRYSQEKKAEQIRIAEQKRIAAEKAAQDSIALRKRIEAERKENKRIAEQKRIAAEKAAKEREAEQKCLAEEKAASESGKGANGVYKVGYYYDDGKKQGVVFDVSTDGKHGKIVHLKQLKTNGQAWFHGHDWDERDVAPDLRAKDRKNGAANTYIVKKQTNWQAKYPLHAWCLSLGFGWYMPAIDDVEKIFRNSGLLNKMLTTKGAAELYTNSHSYWSSTAYEADNRYAYIGQTYKGQYRAIHNSKSAGHGIYVRAVAGF